MLIDCFTFNKEHDLLEARLEYLWNLVDYFIIVEADTTFSGIPRDFQYTKHLARYRKYASKIIFCPVSIDTAGLDFSMPVEKFDRRGAAWQVEVAQRNHIAQALSTFRENDKVILSDVDEIPSKVAIRVICENISPTMPMAACTQQMFYYNFNNVQVDPWPGPIITTVAKIRELTPEGVRLKRYDIPSANNGGWHLSCWMTPDEIVEKIKSFSHQEYNREPYTNIDFIRDNINAGRDFLGREFNKFEPFGADKLPEDFRNIFLKTVKI